jgi:uncharacterized protein (TIGR03083 family)
MTMTEPVTVPVDTLPPLAHDEAMTLLREELDRTLQLLRSLDDAQWAMQTDCPDWDVRKLYLHVLGACESSASIREQVHQTLGARKTQKRLGGPLEANLSALQVREREDLSTRELVERIDAVAPRTVRARTRLPRLLRSAVRIPVDGPVVETWSLGYLSDVIYLRDLWMHRVDATRATGAPLELTAEHDGRIVADVVVEWARRHGQAFALTLTGPAGGSFTGGTGPAEDRTMDAVQFARTLAGRAPADGLLTTVVPF